MAPHLRRQPRLHEELRSRADETGRRSEQDRLGRADFWPRPLRIAAIGRIKGRIRV